MSGRVNSRQYLFLRDSNSHQVALPDDVHMTQFMPGDVVGQGAHAYTMSVGDTGPDQRGVVQALEEGDCGLPHRCEFIERADMSR